MIGGGVDCLTFLRCRIEGNGGAAVVGPADYNFLEWRDCIAEGNGRNDLPGARSFSEAAPIAAFEGPSEAKAGEELVFHCTTANVQTALWDFGDGIPAVGAEVTHTYGSPGEYPVTLIAWTAAGRGSRATKAVRVSG